MIKAEDVRTRIAEYVAARVDAQYRAIIEKMANGHLYGEPIDFDDPKMLVVAAYCLGQDEERRLAYGDFEDLAKLVT